VPRLSFPADYEENDYREAPTVSQYNRLVHPQHPYHRSSSPRNRLETTVNHFDTDRIVQAKNLEISDLQQKLRQMERQNRLEIENLRSQLKQ
jgi:hypothetical protein